MTRLAPALALFIALSPVAPGPVLAQPEDRPPVSLTLLGQSSVVTRRQPLRVTVMATNTSAAAYADLELKLWVYNPARSRSEYEAGLDSEPPATPFLVEPLPVEDTLEPGESVSLSIEHGLAQLADRGENALYPLKVQLESDGIPIGVLRSALVFIRERPLVPLNVSVVFVFDQGIRMRPGGEFVGDELERSLAADGNLEAAVSALEDAGVPATLVVSPVLLLQLERMSDGYVRDGVEVAAGSIHARRAQAMLDRLRSVARKPATELVALPFAGPSVPSLVAAGLHRDLAQQLTAGQRMVADRLGVEPTQALFRPPGGLLSHDSLRALADLEVDAVLADPETLPPAPGFNLSPPTTARVAAGAGRSLQAVVPDPAVAARLRSLPHDPRLRAQRVVGELSALYFERPSVDRGVAIMFSENARHDRDFLVPFLRSLQTRSLPRGVAWLRPVRATRLLTGSLEGDRRQLVPSPFELYPSEFVDQLAQTREAIAQLESMTDGATALSERLRTTVLISEARDFLRDESAGSAFLNAAVDRVRREFTKVESPTPGSVTLTSRGGVIPVTIRNGAGYRVRVRVTLLSPRLQFLEGDSREVVLERPTQQFTFPVRAQTTGRFPVTIRLETPSGAPIGQSRLVVRSTAYNLVALVITAGAAAFLALWWGRRFLPRASG